MRRTMTLSALVLASALTLPAIAAAQSTPSVDSQRITDTRQDDDSRWGWLGLLGLAGLVGLKRRERDKHGDLGNMRQPV